MRERATIPSRGAAHQAHFADRRARFADRNASASRFAVRGSQRLTASAGRLRERCEFATRSLPRTGRDRGSARQPTMPPMPTETTYHGRRAASIENDHLRVTVLPGGGHIAEVYDKATGVNPLWTPPWTSIEPSQFDPARHPRLRRRRGVAACWRGIIGHNLCLDIFGGPSDDEARAGLPVHGEASIVDYEVPAAGTRSLMPGQACRWLAWRSNAGSSSAARAVWIRETVHNPGGVDKPIGWTQHVTLGPPFLEKGRTQFRASVDTLAGVRVVVRRRRLSAGRRRLRLAERAADRRRHRRSARFSPTRRPPSAYTAHLTDPGRADGVLRGVRAPSAAGVRLCLAPRRFSLAGHLGREPEPDVTRPGIRER